MALDSCKLLAYNPLMIRSFKNKALADLFRTGKTAKIDAKMHKRILVRLDRLEVAERPEDMNLPGFNFHALNGFDPTRYTVHVNGPWCITFEFEGKDAPRVEFEQYH
ncbi:plasmid maintenance system killer protein [Mesorhizobium sp. L-8-3]|nr:plasmid maintenance system killer protein [Mesorhizobium sp. L-8-3]